MTAIAAITAPPEKLDMGQVIQTTFAVLRRNVLRLFPLACVLLITPSLTSTALVATGIAPTTSPLYWFVVLISIVFSAIFQATGIQVLVSDMTGARAEIVSSLWRSLRQILPLMAIVALNLLGILAGSVLLIIPGLAVGAAFAVVFHARIVEHAKVFESFDRSRDLTRGNRWRIFGLFAILVVAFGLIQAGVVGLFGGLAAVAKMDPGLLIASQIRGLATSLISLTGGCVVYVELRRIKDGTGANSMAAIFD